MSQSCGFIVSANIRRLLWHSFLSEPGPSLWHGLTCTLDQLIVFPPIMATASGLFVLGLWSIFCSVIPTPAWLPVSFKFLSSKSPRRGCHSQHDHLTRSVGLRRVLSRVPFASTCQLQSQTCHTSRIFPIERCQRVAGKHDLAALRRSLSVMHHSHPSLLT